MEFTCSEDEYPR